MQTGEGWMGVRGIWEAKPPSSAPGLDEGGEGKPGIGIEDDSGYWSERLGTVVPFKERQTSEEESNRGERHTLGTK